jgi:hypothetical protein
MGKEITIEAQQAVGGCGFETTSVTGATRL